MKKVLISLLMVLMALAPVAAFADVAVVDAATVAEVVDSTAVIAVEAPVKVNNIAASMGSLVVLLIQIGGLALISLISYVAWKYLGKLGVEKSAAANSLLTSLIKQGINVAEAWGVANKKKGSEKLTKAVEVIDGLATSSGIKKWAKGKVEELVEGQLARDKAKADK